MTWSAAREGRLDLWASVSPSFPPMKSLLLAALLLLAAAPRPAATAAIHSHLLLAPNEQCILGGDQPGAFRVAAHNTGPVPVEVRERRRDGQLLVRALLPPGQRARRAFGVGATALLRNRAAQQAVLELDVTGSPPHRMQMGPASGDGRPD